MRHKAAPANMKRRKDPMPAAGSSVEQCRIPRAEELVKQGFHRMLIQSINQSAQERSISHVGGRPGYKLPTEL